MPRFSIVTTCKGRLHHLKQSLPRFLAQRDTEVVVVDYDCPDRAGDFVRGEYPAAKVVGISDAPVFNISRARNLGAEAATGDWLAFLDADALVSPDMMERAAATLQPQGRYYRFRSSDLSFSGSCVVRRDDFLAVQGYDAAIEGYGGEDNDLYGKLARIGIARGDLDSRLIEAGLQHGTRDRVQFYKQKSIDLSIRINAAYRLIKFALLRQRGVPELPDDERRALYAQVRSAVKWALRSRQTSVQIAVALPDDTVYMPYCEWAAKRRIVFDLNLQQTATEAQMRAGQGLEAFLKQNEA